MPMLSATLIVGAVMRFGWLLGVMSVVFTAATPAWAAGLQTDQPRPGFTIVPDTDPFMPRAIRKARDTLDELFAAMRRRTVVYYSVKVPVTDGKETEFFWISNLVREGDQFKGTIDNNPRLVTNIKADDPITFKKEEIVDWFYIEGEQMHGNYTLCAILRNEPPAEAHRVKKQFGLTCRSF